MSSQNFERVSRYVSPLLKELVLSLLNDQPEEPLPYMIKWLENKIGIQNSKSEKEELFELRQEISRIKNQNEEVPSEDEEKDD